MDLERLSAAPWVIEGVDQDGMVYVNGPGQGKGPQVCRCGSVQLHNRTSAAFIVLARNAFDVMMRRGWWAEPIMKDEEQSEVAFFIVFPNVGHPTGHWPDPFTALVEADRWYRENVEKPG